jgi:hypothetical protein
MASTTTLTRQCKVDSDKEFSAKNPRVSDNSSTKDSDIEDSSADESRDDEGFVVHDKSSGSEEAYCPGEDSSEDDDGSVSSDSDHQYALSAGSDDE